MSWHLNPGITPVVLKRGLLEKHRLSLLHQYKSGNRAGQGFFSFV
jgi:hypothetical protein